METIVSVAVCPYVILIEEIEVSMLSMPASMAFIFVAVENPVVACVCICMGIDIFSFSLETNSNAAFGFNNPAISLIATESAPASSICLAKSNQLFKVCTGETV